jgi:hypothetical protein
MDTTDRKPVSFDIDKHKTGATIEVQVIPEKVAALGTGPVLAIYTPVNQRTIRRLQIACCMQY